jgi:RNA polymerase sigma-70 factor (ECF subfamily)
MWMSAGDEPVVVGLESFESFYRREFRAMVGLALALSGSRIAAEDLAQEAMMVAHKRWAEVARLERPDAWVRRVVSNMAVSAYRKRASEARALARLAARRQEVIPELEPADDRFWRAVRSLPKKQSQAIALHYLEDMAVADIAEVLDCSPSTAKVHLFRGRKTLATMLEREEGR